MDALVLAVFWPLSLLNFLPLDLSSVLGFSFLSFFFALDCFCFAVLSVCFLVPDLLPSALPLGFFSPLPGRSLFFAVFFDDWASDNVNG